MGYVTNIKSMLLAIEIVLWLARSLSKLKLG